MTGCEPGGKPLLPGATGAAESGQLGNRTSRTPRPSSCIGDLPSVPFCSSTLSQTPLPRLAESPLQMCVALSPAGDLAAIALFLPLPRIATCLLMPSIS